MKWIMSWGLALKFMELPFTTTTIYHLREKTGTTHKKLQIYKDGYWNSILGFNTKWNEGHIRVNVVNEGRTLVASSQSLHTYHL